MRYIIAICLATLLSVSPALAAEKSKPDANAPVSICRDVQTASQIHEVIATDVDAGLALIKKYLTSGRCKSYKDGSVWKVMQKNQNFGYAKVLYDLGSDDPKVGFVPWAYIMLTGR